MDSVQTIELTCYENDDNILELLRENLWACQANSKKSIQIQIITDNYITSQYLDLAVEKWYISFPVRGLRELISSDLDSIF